MNILNRLSTLVAVLLLSMTAFVTTTSAATVTFTHSGSGTGTIGGTPFNNADFSIKSLGNTDDRQGFGSGFFLDHLSSVISIDGLGDFTVITPTRTFVNQNVQVVGYSRAGIGGTDLFNGPNNSAFATWDMLSSIGPIAGSGRLLQWSSPSILTSGGQLLFNNETGVSAIFQASVSPIPEPSTYILLVLGLGVLGIRYRQKLNS